MLDFETANEALSDIVDNLPQQILQGLNGGIILLPDTKLHPNSRANDLYIMGQYHYDPLGLGRYITINYGSFCKLYSYLPDGAFIKEMEKTLRHELVHHLEHQAGDRSLEKEDAIHMAEYLGEI